MKILFYNLTPSVFSDPSAAQEKLAVWLVVVVGIAAAVEFVTCFCAFWDFDCLFFFFWEKGGGSTCLDYPPPSNPGSTHNGLVEFNRIDLT